jgi:hypothetical protein
VIINEQFNIAHERRAIHENGVLDKHTRKTREQHVQHTRTTRESACWQRANDVQQGVWHAKQHARQTRMTRDDTNNSTTTRATRANGACEQRATHANDA